MDHLIVPSGKFQIVIRDRSFKLGLEFKSSSNSLFVISNEIHRPREFLFATAKRFPKSILAVSETLDVLGVGPSMEAFLSFVVTAEGGHVCSVSEIDNHIRS